MGKGKTQLTEKWIHHEEYKSWLRKGATVFAARCCLCKKEINVQNGVGDSLKKHASGKGQKKLAEEFVNPCVDFGEHLLRHIS